MQISEFKSFIEGSLLPNIQLKTVSPVEPIIVENHTEEWKLLGKGNYAAVFTHPAMPDWVVKIYGRNPEGLQKEIFVYEKLGSHKAYSRLGGYGRSYLILKRIEGITLFHAMVKGIPIPVSVIHDIDSALQYARDRGLNPFDVHGKNVVMNKNRGYIVDISDFYKSGYCSKWDDLKKAYYWIYRPLILKWHPPFPFRAVDSIRTLYRLYRKLRKRIKKAD
ncbi:serine/threonine protein kinase [Peribacillus kribbensis]|uniref:serine/threonine protein kinase n=1 Tax=Peribacillus kribbensis TaxID=356658 RepID=UPI00040E2B76|nr:serine/threonine protein kinase [Peribacillus kribbensis]